MELIVKNDSLLLEYLYENIKDKSKNNIKTLLKNGIFVNDKMTTKLKSYTRLKLFFHHLHRILKTQVPP